MPIILMLLLAVCCVSTCHNVRTGKKVYLQFSDSHPHCTQGQEPVQVLFANHSYYTCLPCAPAYFSSADDVHPCKQCLTCAENEVLVKPCTANLDTVCKPLGIFSSLEQCEVVAVITHSVMLVLLIQFLIVAAAALFKHLNRMPGECSK